MRSYQSFLGMQSLLKRLHAFFRNKNMIPTRKFRLVNLNTGDVARVFYHHRDECYTFRERLIELASLYGVVGEFRIERMYEDNGRLIWVRKREIELFMR